MTVSADDEFSSFQDDEVDLYVGVTKCLSEMSDTEIDRIARVTEVHYDVIKSDCRNAEAVCHTNSVVCILNVTFLVVLPGTFSTCSAGNHF